VLFHEIADNLFVSFKGFDGSRFLVLHQTTVTGDIGAGNGCELLVKAFRSMPLSPCVEGLANRQKRRSWREMTLRRKNPNRKTKPALALGLL
jgi:hypothetical protein